MSLAIVEARDDFLARQVAEAAGIHEPGAISIADEVDPASVPLELIGRKLDLADLPIKKPPAPSVRRSNSVKSRNDRSA